MVRASGCQCESRNSPGFDPNISEILGAADEAVLNTVHREKTPKNPLVISVRVLFLKFVYST